MTNTGLCKRVSIMGATLLLFESGLAGQARNAKLKAEDIVVRHLASIGTAEARAAVRTRNVGGNAGLALRQGGQRGTLTGRGLLLSEGRKLRLDLSFSAQEYPGDQVAFDGSKVTVGRIRPGDKSTLSDFVSVYDTIVREGLLGGTLTVAWALLDVPDRQPKVEYPGLKKIDGKQLHELRYKPKRSNSKLEVTLYFDLETFQHVRTQYRLVTPPEMPQDRLESVRQQDTVTTITEEFSDFNAADGLTLPRAYKLSMNIDGGSPTFLADWTIVVAQIAHNQQIEPQYFSVQ